MQPGPLHAHSSVLFASSLPIFHPTLGEGHGCFSPFAARAEKDEGLGWDIDGAAQGAALTATVRAPPQQHLQKIKACSKNSKREELVGWTSGGQKQLLLLSRQEVKEER